MNTRLEYLYRDACNYKEFSSLVVSGLLKEEDLKPFLKDSIFFIPSEVGLKDLQNETFSEDDHIWHELVSVAQTTEAPTIEVTASKLVSMFKLAGEKKWNEFEVYDKKGLLWGM